MSSISFWDWFLVMLGIKQQPAAQETESCTLNHAEEVNPETGDVERFIIAPGGYRIRVPQPGELSHSMSELLPSVRESLAMVPPLPHVVGQLLREVQNATSTADSVAAIAASDAGLAAALLRTVNSAAMGLNRKITSVSEAVSYLGFSLVKSVVLRLRLDDTLKVHPDRAIEAEDLWVHALATSYVAEILADKVPGVDRGFCSTLALMHDIGKLAMLSHLTNHLQSSNAATNPGASLLAREAQALGTDHAGLGASLAHSWKLPADLVRAIRFHHHPSNAFEATDPKSLRQSVHLVCVANQLAKYCYPYAEELEIDALSKETAEILGLDVSIEKLLDDKVRQAIGKAILFAAENAKNPKLAVRPFLQLRKFAAATKLLSANPELVPTQVTINDILTQDLFDPQIQRDAKTFRKVHHRSSANEITRMRDTMIEHQHHFDLPAALKANAEQVVRHLLPNLVSSQPETNDAIQSWDGEKLTIAIRSNSIRFDKRIGIEATKEHGQKLLQLELSALFNLGWIDSAVTSTYGTTLVLVLK